MGKRRMGLREAVLAACAIAAGAGVVVCLALIVFAKPSGALLHSDGVVFDRPLADLGEVAQGSRQAIEFRFVNKSREAVRIATVRPSCGCIIASHSEGWISPGGQGSVWGELTIAKEEGQEYSLRKRIVVTFDGDGSPQQMLHIVATAVQVMRIEPRRLEFVVRADGTSTAPRCVMSPALISDKAFQGARISCEQPVVKISVVKSSERSLTFEATLNSQFPPDMLPPIIATVTDDIGVVHSVEIPITVRRDESCVTPIPRSYVHQISRKLAQQRDLERATLETFTFASTKAGRVHVAKVHTSGSGFSWRLDSKKTAVTLWVAQMPANQVLTGRLEIEWVDEQSKSAGRTSIPLVAYSGP